MLSMVNNTATVSNTNSSTTNTSASMNSGNSVAHTIASLAHSGPQCENVGAPQQVDVLTLQNSFQQPDTINSAANNAAAVLTSVSRASAPKKRSTRSKCSPGLRSGKWTPEEEAFTNMVIHYFKRGLLDVEDGTSLRWYLAKRLNCEAMRVTKKLKGNSSIGKQIFRAMENTPSHRQAIRHAREELGLLEVRFLESLNSGRFGLGLPSEPSLSSLAVSLRGRKILPNMKLGDGNQPLLAPMPVPKSEDARLLLHFFSEAHDNSDEEPDAEKKEGSLTVDLSKKLGKKRPLSSVAKTTEATKTEDTKTESNVTKEEKTPEQDAELPQAKRQAVKTDTPTE